MSLILEQTFRGELAEFKQLVLEKSGEEFVSFAEGLPARWEAYKPKLRLRAREILGTEGWSRDDIGSGRILSSAIEAIEIDVPDLKNNLVAWQERYGAEQRPHHHFHLAQKTASERKTAEEALYDVFDVNADPQAAFAAMVDLVGKRYDLLAYLFYLRDGDRYMPIATTTFDKAFSRMGVDLRTTQRCSWQNYLQYNETLEAVRTLLDKAVEQPVSLIDAHSFCWLLIKLPNASAFIAETGSESKGATATKPKTAPGKTLDGWEKAASAMAINAEAAAKQSKQGATTKHPKPKELRMSPAAIREYATRLMEEQRRRCAITGLPLLAEDDADLERYPSLDRIDSEGHYEEGNLQVVCRFVNRWKGADDDVLFRRLIALVRSSAPNEFSDTD